MPSQAIEKLKAHSLEVLALVLVSVLSAVLLLAESHLAPYIKEVAPVTMLRLLLLLVLLALLGPFAFLYFRPSLKFDAKLGIYHDRKTGLYYCPSCLSKKIRSPLKQGKHGWFCVVKDCRTSFANPDAVPPAAPQLIRGVSRSSYLGNPRW